MITRFFSCREKALATCNCSCCYCFKRVIYEFLCISIFASQNFTLNIISLSLENFRKPKSSEISENTQKS